MDASEAHQRLVAGARDLGRRAARSVAERMTALDSSPLADVLLAGVDRATGARWEAAVERAAALPGTIRPEKIKALTDSFARELATVGAAAGAAVAAPAIGTAGSIAASAAEVAWFTGRAGDLILTIAALHGRSEPTVDERRAWVLAVLLYGSTAREGFTHMAEEVGVTLAAGGTAVAGIAPQVRLPLNSLRAINGGFQRHIVRRYGARRGVVALGRALPLGIGAAIGGGANYAAIRALARHADQFFSRLPYSAIEAVAREAPPG
jgi:hypothetical protein